MRTIPIAAAALVVMAAAASAQTPTTPGAPRGPATTQAPAPAPKPPAVNPLTKEDISQIEGTGVYGNDNSKIGHISNVLMNPESKKVDRLVVSAGGVLGVGGHRVAIPVEKFSWDSGKGVFKLSSTLADLKAMPEWVEGATATGSSTAPKSTLPGSGNGASGSTSR